MSVCEKQHGFDLTKGKKEDAVIQTTENERLRQSLSGGFVQHERDRDHLLTSEHAKIIKIKKKKKKKDVGDVL